MGYNDDFDNFDDFGVVENDDGDYGDSFSERYDMANGAPFGTFDFDGDGELDFLEGAAKLDHYQSLWDEDSSTLMASDDEDSGVYYEDEDSVIYYQDEEKG